MRQIVFVGIALALIGGASAQQNQDGYRLRHGFGLGDASCSEFLHADKEQRQSYIAWIEGFISGINAERRSNILEGTDMDDAVRWITNRCKELPIVSLGYATRSLVLKILASRHRAYTDKNRGGD
jgi:HdeA/HdeB family